MRSRLLYYIEVDPTQNNHLGGERRWQDAHLMYLPVQIYHVPVH